MNKIIVIVGPTGVGKTKLSIELAKHFDGEVINGDSMQVYKELNIGTAKVTEEEKEGVPHHLFDIKDVKDDYTVYDYQRDARITIDNIFKKGKIPVIVGGTGLYIKAALYDYEFNNENYYNSYDDLSNEEIFSKLKEVDNNINIHPNNRQRLVRTMNVYENGGKKKSNGDVLLYDALFIGLTTDRKKLYGIIDQRVEKMLLDGLIDEVKGIYDRGIRSKSINTGIGYKELYKYFDQEISLGEAVDLIKKNSRHYAKRQYTWFNNKMNVTWFNVDYDDFNKTVNEVIKYIKNTND